MFRRDTVFTPEVIHTIQFHYYNPYKGGFSPDVNKLLSGGKVQFRSKPSELWATNKWRTVALPSL